MALCRHARRARLVPRRSSGSAVRASRRARRSRAAAGAAHRARRLLDNSLDDLDAMAEALERACAAPGTCTRPTARGRPRSRRRWRACRRRRWPRPSTSIRSCGQRRQGALRARALDRRAHAEGCRSCSTRCWALTDPTSTLRSTCATRPAAYRASSAGDAHAGRQGPLGRDLSVGVDGDELARGAKTGHVSPARSAMKNLDLVKDCASASRRRGARRARQGLPRGRRVHEDAAVAVLGGAHAHAAGAGRPRGLRTRANA